MLFRSVSQSRYERWIGGEKFKEDDYKGIEQAMKLQRERSKEAGYGSDVQNWNQYIYENEMRELKNAKKMQKALTKF